MKIKNLLPFILVFAILACFASCQAPESDGGTPSTGDYASETPFTADLPALRTNMISTFGAEDPIEFESDVLLDLYGIASEDVEESACYMTMDGVFPQEIVMIKATNADALARISAALEKRIAEVKIQSESYDPENYALAQKCKVETKGLYVTMFLSPHFEEMTSMFNGTK